MQWLIVSAAPFEAKPTLDLMLSKGVDVAYESCGVGALEAARRSPALRQAAKGRNVLFLGTCGSFYAPNKICELVTAASVAWLPTCVRHDLAYQVQGSDLPISLPPPFAKIQLPRRAVVCSPAISVSSRLPLSFDPPNTVENLELYSCAEALLVDAESFSVILAVTNEIGPGAHSQWKANFQLAAQSTANYLNSSVT